MGRPAEGPKLWWKRGIAYGRFTWNGQEFKPCLGTRERTVAAQRLAQVYADVVSGRIVISKRPNASRAETLDLALALDEWLKISKIPTLDERSVPMLEGYCRTYVSYFGSLDNITDVTVADFGPWLLGRMLRTTALRLRQYLVQFLAWAHPRGYIRDMPVVPRLPPKAQGVRTGTHRAKAVHVTKAEALAIIKLLPEQSKTIDGRRWPLRARFAFMWQTALRPETISRLSVPENWEPGRSYIELANEDDKARYGRTIDLTPEAVAILRAVAPTRGVIFGHHVFYKALKRAAAQVLDAVRAKDFAPYDFRHGRARERLDAGAKIRGVSYLLGHKRVSTTDKYLEPNRADGKDALHATTRSRTKPAPKKPRRKR